jgi:putative sigma-54 modulation protein
MNVYKLVGRNVEVTDALRNYVEGRLAKLERFSNQIIDAKVVLTVRTDSRTDRSHRVEVQINVPNGIIRAEETAADMYAAIDSAGELLERQLKRFKEKLISRQQYAELPEIESDIEDEPSKPEIVRSKRFEMRPMVAEDAAAQMEALNHDFFMFMNSETDKINVIYRRHDGNYGLLEPH